MNSTYKNIILPLIAVGVCVAGFLAIRSHRDTAPLDPTPQNVTLSGTYVCLPHTDTAGPQSKECAFGLKTDDGVYYAVNFGQSASAMAQFQSKGHIKAEGFVVIKEALNTDQWNKYNMKGIFTITRMIDPAPAEIGFEGEADPARMTLGMKPWIWISALYNDGREVRAKADKFVLTLAPNGKFTAKTDCNSMGGSYVVKDKTIAFSNIFQTEMYCEGSQESVFASILETTSSYHFTSKGELIFDLKFDSGTATFR